MVVDVFNLLIGLVVSVLVGAVVIWLLVDKWAWSRVSAQPTTGRPLTWAVGMVERLLYTGAILLGLPLWFGVWLALKGAFRWKGFQSDEDTFNIFLFGNALSVAFGVLGALIALRGLPGWCQ